MELRNTFGKNSMGDWGVQAGSGDDHWMGTMAAGRKC